MHLGFCVLDASSTLVMCRVARESIFAGQTSILHQSAFFFSPLPIASRSPAHIAAPHLPSHSGSRQPSHIIDHLDTDSLPTPSAANYCLLIAPSSSPASNWPPCRHHAGYVCHLAYGLPYQSHPTPHTRVAYRRIVLGACGRWYHRFETSGIATETYGEVGGIFC